jgi:hypothetical protein
LEMNKLIDTLNKSKRDGRKKNVCGMFGSKK